MATYSDRQKQQYRRFMDWTKREGGVEGPTHLSTLMTPRQISRLSWLKENVTGRILEVGSNYGFVLAWVGGHVGVDISRMNVELAKLLSPLKEFYCVDATRLPFDDMAFDTVMLPEVLEHLDFPDRVHLAIDEAGRVARSRVLITMPDGRTDSADACCFKHRWLADTERVNEVLSWMPKAHLEYREEFALIKWEREA